mgnify:FL=1
MTDDRSTARNERLQGLLAATVMVAVYAWFWRVSAHRIDEGPSFAGFAGIFVTGCGDFEHFYDAARAMRDGMDIYSSGAHGYIYPPLVAFLYMPLTHLGVQSAARLMLAVNMLLALWCTWAATAEAARRLWPAPSRRAFALALALAMLLAAPRLRTELQMWQTNILMMCGLMLALKTLDSRPWLAGLALGFAINIKYLPLIFLPYLLLRRRWAAAAWTVLGITAFAMLPAAQTGLAANARHWLTATAGLAQLFGLAVPAAQAAHIDPISAGYSLSVTSALARTLGADAGMRMAWLGSAAAAMVVALAIVAMYGRMGLARFDWPAASEQRAQPFLGLIQLDWAALIVIALAFSPQTNPRHTSLLLLAFAPLAAAICAPQASAGRRAAALGAAVLFGAFVNPLLLPGLESFASWWNRVGGPAWGMLACIPFLYAVGSGLGRNPARDIAVSHDPRKPVRWSSTPSN